MCQKPGKLFFCDVCIASHVIKPGSHTLFQVEVTDLLDADLQNARHRYVVDLLDKLHELTTVLHSEQTGLERNVLSLYEERQLEVAARYQKECERLWKVCEEMQGRVRGLYTKLGKALEVAKGQIKRLETDMQVQLSTEANAFVQLSCHWDKKWAPFVDVRKALSHKDGSKAYAQLVSSWMCDTQHCRKCASTLSGLNVAKSPPLPGASPPTITCMYCGNTCLSAAGGYCQDCGSSNPVYGNREVTVRITIEESTWLCQSCNRANTVQYVQGEAEMWELLVQGCALCTSRGQGIAYEMCGSCGSNPVEDMMATRQGCL